MMCVCIHFSSVFAMGERSDMGLYDVPSSAGLFGFRMGMILACFQGRGIMLLLSAVLYMSVRY